MIMSTEGWRLAGKTKCWKPIVRGAGVTGLVLNGSLYRLSYKWCRVYHSSKLVCLVDAIITDQQFTRMYFNWYTKYCEFSDLYMCQIQYVSGSTAFTPTYPE